MHTQTRVMVQGHCTSTECPLPLYAFRIPVSTTGVVSRTSKLNKRNNSKSKQGRAKVLV